MSIIKTFLTEQPLMRNWQSHALLIFIVKDETIKFVLKMPSVIKSMCHSPLSPPGVAFVKLDV